MKKLFFACALFSASFFAIQAQSTTNAITPSRPPPAPFSLTRQGGSSNSLAMVGQPASPSPQAVVPNPNTITPQEWQEVNAARAAALKANPALMQKAVELSAKMRDFQQKLDAAIVKVDPNTAPIIAHLEHGPTQRPPIPMQAPHQGTPGYPPPSTNH